MDILIKWDCDKSQNIVGEKDLVFLDGKRKGGNVKMFWSPDNTWWTGQILAIAGQSPEDSDDDVPLAKIARKSLENKSNKTDGAIDIDDEDDFDNDDTDPDYIPSDTEEAPVMNSNCCERSDCNIEIFAACQRCLKMMCYDHFVSICVFCSGNPPTEPQNYDVEGAQREHQLDLSSPTLSRAETVKVSRNAGLPYYTEKTNNFVEARNHLKVRCESEICEKRDLECKSLTNERRNIIQTAYYNISDLNQKRTWLAAHIKSTEPDRTTLDASKTSRKTRTLHYHLPGQNGDHLPVCRVMFLATLNISERQVRTALDKVSTEGVVQSEQRGGRQNILKNRDAEIREICKSHILKFPKTESHYCRSKTNYQYLSGELSISKMFDMFQESTGKSDISISTYYRVFKSLKLKFNKPKKDLCGLCESYRNGDDNKKNQLHQKYTKHISEKEAVRKLKEMLKRDTDDSHLIASFDLQQVIYLPKTNRCEVFYKRRLSNYNFTIYSLKTKKVNCYIWNESLAARGSNEISSCVYDFLKSCDQTGLSQISFFADGCSGQNKNSILPIMLQDFLQSSKFIEQITVFYFETNHGQNEGDSVHSTIERALKRAGDIILPSQLSTVIKLARRDPYSVIEIQTRDIIDWKSYAQQLRILRVRVSEEGQNIDWTSVMQLKLTKSDSMKIFFKLSHLDANFFTLNIDSRRNSSTSLALERAYYSQPKISSDKFTDLQSLCSGETPVMVSEEAKTFYNSLPH